VNTSIITIAPCARDLVGRRLRPDGGVLAAAQELRILPAVEAFLVRYPGAPALAYEVQSGFPLWLRVSRR
jgi:hypothetical protein